MPAVIHGRLPWWVGADTEPRSTLGQPAGWLEAVVCSDGRIPSSRVHVLAAVVVTVDKMCQRPLDGRRVILHLLVLCHLALPTWSTRGYHYDDLGDAAFASSQCGAIETTVLLDGAEVPLRLSHGDTAGAAVEDFVALRGLDRHDSTLMAALRQAIQGCYSQALACHEWKAPSGTPGVDAGDDGARADGDAESDTESDAEIPINIAQGCVVHWRFDRRANLTTSALSFATQQRWSAGSGCADVLCVANQLVCRMKKEVPRTRQTVPLPSPPLPPPAPPGPP